MQYNAKHQDNLQLPYIFPLIKKNPITPMVKPFNSHVQRGIFSWDFPTKHAEWVEIFKKGLLSELHLSNWLFVCLMIDSLCMFTKMRIYDMTKTADNHLTL